MTRARVLAAGGVLWRGDPAAPEVALVHRPAYDDWSLPKGKNKAGEHVVLTALREVREETGHEVRLGPFLTTTRYPVTNGGRPAVKTVHHWAMQCVGGEFAPSREVDALRWLPLDQARGTVDTARDGRVLAAFARAPVDTVPLLLVRHGPTSKAQKGRGRPDPGRRRPGLDRAGRAQAATLTSLLSGIGATRLLAADLPPCGEMLEPYAAAAGLDLEIDPRLTASGVRGHEHDLARELQSQAARAAGQGALAVCGQRRVIAAMVDAMGRASRHRAPEPLEVKKGGWWLLHHRSGDVVAFERHEPAA